MLEKKKKKSQNIAFLPSKDRWNQSQIHLPHFPLLENGRGDDTSQAFWAVPSTPSPNTSSQTRCAGYQVTVRSGCAASALRFSHEDGKAAAELRIRLPRHTYFLTLQPCSPLPSLRGSSCFIPLPAPRHPTFTQHTKALQERWRLHSDKARKHQEFEQKLWVCFLKHQPAGLSAHWAVMEREGVPTEG